MSNPWLLAIRPKTLGLSLTPVAVGSALACAAGHALHWGAFAAALLAALLIQIATNLHNDAADFERGTDTPGRLGPRRAVAEGWLTAEAVRRAALGCFGAAFLLGGYLAAVGGWPIVAIGLASLAAGWGYTGGPWPVAYSPFGELFVFLFFGLAAVLGSYWLHAGLPGPAAAAAAAALGLLAAAVLTVNNYRDLESDRRAGRRTLAILLGRGHTPYLYATLLLLPYPLLLPLAPAGTAGGLAAWLTLPLALHLIGRFLREPVGPGFNTLLARTAQLQTLFGLLLAAGLLLR